jgi:hypothetical protein
LKDFLTKAGKSFSYSEFNGFHADVIIAEDHHPLIILRHRLPVFDQVIVLPGVNSPQYFGTALPETLSFLIFTDILNRCIAAKEPR